MKFSLIVCIVWLFTHTVSVKSQETIAFTATKGERNGPYISYHTMLANSSAKFNPLYGVFMCTEPGLYFFTFQILSEKDSDLRVSLRTNRIPTVTAFSGSKTSYNMASGTAILELEVDDIVYLFIEEGDFYESRQVNRAYTSFTGYRIGSAASDESGGGGFLSSIMGRKTSVAATTGAVNNIGPDVGKTSDSEIDTKDNIYNLLNTNNNTNTQINIDINNRNTTKL
ncbi:complement C1q tumor necrosis factor-related protein 2-like [Oppia nitens]|uniref:complement C1q tumor necrosis factor-related protein 2-like n=1 Tax=Oppia nitens TaxID=1686743 RepID=UPI0023DBEF3D|nr:complement C1q tumor necrosis factor-related protein 2-like [Oppia nitens]